MLVCCYIASVAANQHSYISLLSSMRYISAASSATAMVPIQLLQHVAMAEVRVCCRDWQAFLASAVQQES